MTPHTLTRLIWVALIVSTATLFLTVSRCATAWTLYTHLGLAADIHPQRYEGIWQDGQNPYLYHTGPRRLFVPGAMDAVSLGIRSGPLFIEASHLSAIEDGLNGAGLTWVSAGINVDLWSSGK